MSERERVEALADAMAACDALHFGCRECDEGNHDRPTLHAQAVLDSTAMRDLLAEAKADALREAADHFDKYDVVTIGKVDVGSNLIPLNPADRLRLMAEEINDGGRDD